eukprot:Protomagalhaensia_wolfi_Nauph_80__3850@NODE_38_length_4465_cov_20_595346_g30_i0_p2_GENE_NODE_38_length_4465_cov_20_595346_g30_i0NODE_38_length_4465_cov_20_595346_g30_i0_p2_ORF_typecomplete_len546_score54_20HA2/PF04408_23/3e06_NODE_38_length_4465_cov_20_595346_g30_i027704407
MPEGQVRIYFTSAPVDDYIEAACATAIQLHEQSFKKECPNRASIGALGAFLIVLPSNEDVLQVYRMMTRYAKHWNEVAGNKDSQPELLITKHTYGSEKLSIGARRFKWPDRRRGHSTREVGIIHASLLHGSRGDHLGGISAIIDPGLLTHHMCHPSLPMSVTYSSVVPATRAQILLRIRSIDLITSPQRQVACYLLMTEHDFRTGLRMDPESDEEFIQSLQTSRSLSSSTHALCWLFENTPTFQKTSAAAKIPQCILPTPTIERGFEHLYMCGLMDDDGYKIEPLYSRFLQWLEATQDVHLARLMLTSSDRRFNCVAECASIVAMLKVCPQPFLEKGPNVNSNRDQHAWQRLCRMSFAVTEGDLISLLNVFRAATAHNNDSRWFSEHMLKRRELLEAHGIASELQKAYRRIHSNDKDSIPSVNDGTEAIMKAIVVAFFQTLVFRRIDKAEPSYTPWRDIQFSEVTERRSTPAWTSSRNIIMGVSESSCFHLGSFNDWPDVAVFYGLVGGSDETLACQHLTPAKYSWLTDLMPHIFKTDHVSTATL